MARLSRKGDVLSVHVGKLELARVKGMGSTDPVLQVRTRDGFYRNSASIDDRAAEGDLRELADMVEWVLHEAQRGRA